MAKRERQTQRTVQTAAEAGGAGHDSSARVVAQVSEISRESFAGPLPPPEVFAQYDPETRKTIVDMAISEQQHRHGMDLKVVSGYNHHKTLGQIFGFLIGLAGVVGGVFLGYQGKSLVGFSTFFAALASLVFVYLQSRKSRPAQPRTNALRRNGSASAG